MKHNNLLQFYNSNGYYIAKSALSKGTIKSVINTIDTLYEQQLSLHELGFKDFSLFQKMKLLFDYNTATYLKVAGALGRLCDVYEIFLSKEIKTLISTLSINKLLIPTGPVVHIMSQDLMIPGGYFGLPAHQDYPSMQGSLDSLVVWVPLVDIDRNFYPLEVIPKSHSNGILSGKMTEKYYEINQSLYKNDDFVPIEVEVGDVVFMSSFTVHRSGTNGKKQDVRLSCSMRFDNLEEESFIKRVYPTVYKRTVDRVFLENGFPTEEQVRQVFNKK